jgi:hypothetical protein
LGFAGGGGEADALCFVGTAGNDTVTADAGGDVTFATSTPGFAPYSVSTTGVQVLVLRGGSGGDDLINVTGGAYFVDTEEPAQPYGVSVIVGSGATATFLATDSVDALTISGSGKVILDDRGLLTLKVNSLSITGSGVLDLGRNNSLLLDNTRTPEAVVRQYLSAGYNSDPASGIGDWLGHGGITSSDAIASHNGANPDFRTSVGYLNGAYAADPLLGGSIPGQPALPADRILIRPALYGDLNLDGKVDDTDLSIFSGLGQYSKAADKFGWLGGDLNYDNKVDDTDLQIFSGAGNYNRPAYVAVPSVVPTVPRAIATAADAAAPSTATQAQAASAGRVSPRFSVRQIRWEDGSRPGHRRWLETDDTAPG